MQMNKLCDQHPGATLALCGRQRHGCGFSHCRTRTVQARGTPLLARPLRPKMLRPSISIPAGDAAVAKGAQHYRCRHFPRPKRGVFQTARGTAIAYVPAARVSRSVGSDGGDTFGSLAIVPDLLVVFCRPDQHQSADRRRDGVYIGGTGMGGSWVNGRDRNRIANGAPCRRYSDWRPGAIRRRHRVRLLNAFGLMIQATPATRVGVTYRSELSFDLNRLRVWRSHLRRENMAWELPDHQFSFGMLPIPSIRNSSCFRRPDVDWLELHRIHQGPWWYEPRVALSL